MIIGTAGHIDHGKSALVLALTGTDPDRWEEEKARGITLDLGYAYTTCDDGTRLGFVDVPGHERLVHNMLAGATGIDFVLLVIAADDGPMPQTREHLEIIDLLGLGRGAVALTKLDLVDAERLAEVQAQVTGLLDGTSLAGAPVFPVSSVTGAGLDALRAHLTAQAALTRSRDGRGRFRLAVDRAFVLKGAGVVVTGTAHSGSVALDDHLVLSPRGLEVRVRGIHAQNAAVERGWAGQRCALNLTGPRFEKDSVSRGDWLVAPDLHSPTDRLDVELRVARHAGRPLQHWTPVHVHIGAARVTGRVAVLEGEALDPGTTGLVQLGARCADARLARRPGDPARPVGATDARRRPGARRRATYPGPPQRSAHRGVACARPRRSTRGVDGTRRPRAGRRRSRPPCPAVEPRRGGRRAPARPAVAGRSDRPGRPGGVFAAALEFAASAAARDPRRRA